MKSHLIIIPFESVSKLKIQIFIFQNNNFYVKSDIITQHFFQSEIQFADIFQVMPTFVNFKQLFFGRIFGNVFQPFFEAF